MTHAATAVAVTVVTLALAAGCGRPRSPTPATTPTQPAVVPPAPTLRERIGAAAEVRVEEHQVLADGRHAVRAWPLRDPAAVTALLDAIGLDQRPGGGCPRCSPRVRLFFLDPHGMSLGYLGADCGPAELPDPDLPEEETSAEARFETGSSEDCRLVRVRDPAGLRRAITADRPSAEPTQRR